MRTIIISQSYERSEDIEKSMPSFLLELMIRTYSIIYIDFRHDCG